MAPRDCPPHSFPTLTLPSVELKLRQKGHFTEVQCLSRKSYVRLEPEEWVRQHWLHYLNQQLGYPIGVMVAEYPLKINGMNRRADIVCHDTIGNPILMVECKRPGVKLSQASLNQVMRYNIELQIPCLVISNGLQHHVYALQNNKLQALDHIPPYSPQ